jgi:spore germination protein GerM
MAAKKASLGCLFWLALVLLVIVVFLFNQKNIQRVVEKTGLLDLFKKKEIPIEIDITPTEAPVTQTDEGVPQGDGDAQPVVIDVGIEEEEDDGGEEPSPAPVEKPNLRKATLYFVEIGTDADIRLKGVSRPVHYGNSPLRETLTVLLKGLQSPEINQGLRSMIPVGVILRNVYVKESTAFVDFSENFAFNSLGQSGLKAQLQQAIYTTTEFSNVESVQILIEGTKQKYLNSEGLYIGSPLSRESF